jgi:uncharacterized protein (DUF697 family)
MSNEPVAIGAAIIALATAVLGLLSVFGVDITQEQTGAILLVITAVIGFVGALVRSKVTPTNKL